jgi:hypothetical protein
MQKRGYEVALDVAYKIKFGRPHRSLLIDVDVFYPWRDKTISTQSQGDGSFVGEVFPRDAFDRFREIVFLHDLRVLIPDPPETVLETIYGDWRTPDRACDSHWDLLNRLRIPLGDPMPQLSTAVPAPPPIVGADL